MAIIENMFICSHFFNLKQGAMKSNCSVNIKTH